MEDIKSLVTKKRVAGNRAKEAVVIHGKKAGDTSHTPRLDEKTSEANC